MTRFRPLLAGVTLSLALGPVGVPAAAQARPSNAVMGLRPAVAEGSVPALAWAAHTRGGRIRVRAAIPAQAPGRTVGPRGPGDDGAPTLARLREDRFMIAAARGANGGSRIWWSSRRLGDGSEPRYLDSQWSRNHHPALASGDGNVWIVWVASDRGEATERLVATSWDGRDWGSPEVLPGAPGTPMAPRMAIDASGEPLVVWAASDGTDAEIWVSRRGHGRWEAPSRLTNNAVPDIDPVIAVDGWRVAVAWSRFSPDGYFPIAVQGNARSNQWRRARQLDTRPGSNPAIVRSGSRIHVAWASVAGEASVLRSAPLIGRPGRVTDLARIPNARVAASGSIIGWAAADMPGAARLTAGGSHGAAPRLHKIAGDARPRARESSVLTLPGTYRGFGDSITEGVVVNGGVITVTEGYTVPLGDLISALIQRRVVVRNDGRAGETTAEGLERLPGLVLTSPKLFNFIMEGTNDVSTLTDAATIVTNLRAMVLRVRSAGGTPVLGTLIPRVNERDGGVHDEHTTQVNAALVTMAAEQGVMLVDQSAAFAPRPDLYSDRLHPSVSGYDFMAGVWFRGLQPILIHLLKQEDTEDGLARDSVLFPDRASSGSRRP